MAENIEKTDEVIDYMGSLDNFGTKHNVIVQCENKNNIQASDEPLANIENSKDIYKHGSIENIFKCNKHEKNEFCFNHSNKIHTIMEEPTISKLTVREILARFETLNSDPSDPEVIVDQLDANKRYSIAPETSTTENVYILNSDNNQSNANDEVISIAVIDSNQQTEDLDHFEDNLAFDDKVLLKWQGHSMVAPISKMRKELHNIALYCFKCILMYAGEIPRQNDMSEIKCVYLILMNCYKYLGLRDEIYIQLIKQTIQNQSPNMESLQKTWRLIAIVSAYFTCSKDLEQFVMKHFENVMFDQKFYAGISTVCLENFKKTSRCGGRKNVPSVEEITAVTAGRSARRQIYRLPGGFEKVVNTTCSTVAHDVLIDLCNFLGIYDHKEILEFSLYCVLEGDVVSIPLALDEYILDVTTEFFKSNQSFYIIFFKSIWCSPIKTGPSIPPLYTEVLFNQVIPDYLEGLLCQLPNSGILPTDIFKDVAYLAALLHKAADFDHSPTKQEIKFLLPKIIFRIKTIQLDNWLSFIQNAWLIVKKLHAIYVKYEFLVILSRWVLFGSSFFVIKKAHYVHQSLEDISISDMILALNPKGVFFLNYCNHQTIQFIQYSSIISSRKSRSEYGVLYLDIKILCGNLEKIIRIQTEQAYEIARLLKQYIVLLKK